MKLYLFERDIIGPLNKYMEKNSNMQLKSITTKCSGLEVMAPVPIAQPKKEDS